MADAKSHPLNHCALGLAQRLIALDAKSFVLTVEGIKDEDVDKIDDIEIVVRYKQAASAVVPPDVDAALEALQRLDASACAGPATHWPEDVETVRLAIAGAVAAGDEEPWTDEQCLQFASVAFRHAGRNLPKGVLIEDIRLGVQHVQRISARSE